MQSSCKLKIPVFAFILFLSTTMLNDSQAAVVNSPEDTALDSVEAWNGVLEKSDIEKLIAKENDVIFVMMQMKRRILKAHKDYSIAKTVGSSVSTAGTIAMIGGFILAPFTAGWSLTLTVGGLTSTILGSSTTLTTGIIETVKQNQWADELIQVLDERETEFKRIGQKIITHPTWTHYVGRVASGTFYTITKVPQTLALARILKYLAITAPIYGLDKWPAFAFAAKQLFGTSLLYPLPAEKLPSYFYKHLKLLDKGFLKIQELVGRSLAKMGITGVKLSMTGVQILSAGVGGIGIILDVYTIVDTWVNHPSLVSQIDKIIVELEKTTMQLEVLKKDF